MEYDNKSRLIEIQTTIYNSVNPTRRWLHCSRRDWVLASLYKYSKILENREWALEIGPGSGVYLPILCRLFKNVAVIDVEYLFLDVLSSLKGKFTNIHYIHNNVLDIALKSETVDLILCSEVIEHIPDTKMVLENLHRLLRKDGILILTTPQKYSVLEICSKVAFLPGVINIVRKMYKEPVDNTGHVNLMTDVIVEKALTKAGFEIYEKNKLGMYIPLVAELLGTSGLRIVKIVQKIITNTRFDFLLWTQCYVARKC